MIIDTHLHVIDLEALDYPWLEGVPPLNRNFPYETYATEARRVGIARSLHMEVDVEEIRIEDETRYIKGLSAEPGSLIAGAISACRPEAPEFPAFLERQRTEGFIKGFRRVLHVVPDDVSTNPLFRENIARLVGTGLTYDVCVQARQLELAIALVDAAPDVQFILDHCGVPDIKGEEWQPWSDNIRDIARRPNVVAKISGVVAYADPDFWTVETLRPWVEHVIECFGWDRVVWGSDWPVCTLGGGLSTWVGATRALLEGTSKSEADKLLFENARRIWSID